MTSPSHDNCAGAKMDDGAEMDRIEADYQRELELIEIWGKQERERIKAAFKAEEEALDAEYSARVGELVEGLYNEWEEKKRQLEGEINSLDIACSAPPNSSTYYYPYPYPGKKTLRRRANEPVAETEKRPRKNSPQTIVHLLPEGEIAEDIRAICGGRGAAGSAVHSKTSAQPPGAEDDKATLGGHRKQQQKRTVTVDAARLVCDGKTFHRGQNVIVETANYGKFPASIQTLSEKCVQFRSTLAGDTRQVMATRDDLETGRVIVRKRY